MSVEVLREAARLMRERANADSDQEHCSAMTPAVALAVADVLESLAGAHVHINGREISVCDMPGMDDSPAMALAHACLGEAS